MKQPDQDPLWRKVKKTVAPLKKKSSRADPGHRPESHMMRVPPKPAATTRTPAMPLNINQDKRVRRGRIDIDVKIDLHDLTQAQAYPALERALIRAANRNLKCVLVVTGKGARLEGVLRRAFPGWINSPDLRPLVASYAPAHIRHGGSGAWYVFLKTPS